MLSRGRRALVLFAALGVTECRRPPPPRPRFARTFDATLFQKGNLHTHTARSDGEGTPLEVAGWYEAHGYAFLALTDHDVFTPEGFLDGAPDGSFQLLSGEEISMWWAGRQVHVNALCTKGLVTSGTFPTARAALEHAVGDVLAEGGIALVNHPNFDWALTPEDVLAVPGARLLEIASGHPYVHSNGDATHPSHEAIWDRVLTAGHDVMGVAVDDTHRFRADEEPPALPGRGWVEVWGAEKTAASICDALRAGNLYASTGVELRRVRVTESAYDVVPVDGSARVVFIGEGGHELESVDHAGAGARYTLVGAEGYVRARVESGAFRAWTPAVRVER